MFFGCSVYRARQGKSRFIIEKAFGFQVLWIIATLTFAWMNSAAAATVNADEASVREGRIRAATVFYLSRFVEWPSTAVAAKDSGIRVCLRGNDNSTMFFAATFEGQSAGTQPLMVAILPANVDLSELKLCEILYIGKIPTQETEKLLRMTQHLPILTVSGTEDITDKHGGIIYLFVENNKLRIKINYESSRVADLKVSAELLNVAIVARASGVAALQRSS